MNIRRLINRTTALAFVSLILLLMLDGCGTGPGEDNMGPSGPPNGSLFDSGHISPDGTFSYTFTTRDSTISYFCELHSPDMKGSVTVQSGSSNTDQDTVEMSNETFSPSQITIAPNTTIVWVNHDSFDHTVINGSPSDNNGGGGSGGY